MSVDDKVDDVWTDELRTVYSVAVVDDDPDGWTMMMRWRYVATLSVWQTVMKRANKSTCVDDHTLPFYMAPALWSAVKRAACIFC